MVGSIGEGGVRRIARGDSSAWLRMTIQKDVMIASKPNPVLGQP